MRKTDQTLLEQMRITDFELEHRKALFALSAEDIRLLVAVKPEIEREVDSLVERFYELQTSVPEIALLIGDSDTLGRLRNAQRRYVIDLFSGFYDIEYVNNRLRIGLVHKRIGVEPKLYLSAIYTLKHLLIEFIHQLLPDEKSKFLTVSALEKLLMFDVALVFETYIRSLISEIEISREKSEQYAHALEEKVRERTLQLEKQSRTDPLTGLLNMRHLNETLTYVLRGAARRSEPVTVVYIDVNDFKTINDTKGHQRGDEVLCNVANAIQGITRIEDHCFRYGGDEFCIIMSNCTATQAENICQMRLLAELHSREKELTLSVGYAQTGPSEYVSPEVLIRQADESMYIAKHAFKMNQR